MGAEVTKFLSIDPSAPLAHPNIMKSSTLLILRHSLFLAAFYFYPLAAILQTSFASGGGFAELFTDAYYARVLLFTIFQAALSTLLTLIVALPAAYIFARYAFRGASILRALTTIPFLMPTIVVATAFSALFGPRGSVNLALMQLFRLDSPPIQILNTLWIILLAHTFYNFTIVLRIVGGFWSNLDPQIENAARVLGANRWRTFRHVTLPLIAPAIVAAALLVFIFDFTSFGVVLDSRRTPPRNPGSRNLSADRQPIQPAALCRAVDDSTRLHVCVDDRLHALASTDRPATAIASASNYQARTAIGARKGFGLGLSRRDADFFADAARFDCRRIV